MKNYKGNMLLIELVIVLLFFSLSQVAVVQVFAGAQRKAADSRVLYGALMAAEDVAERLCREPEPDAALTELGFMGENGIYILCDEAGYDLYVSLHRLQQPAGQLITANLTARQGERELFSLPSAYYLPEAPEAEPIAAGGLSDGLFTAGISMAEREGP